MNYIIATFHSQNMPKPHGGIMQVPISFTQREHELCILMLPTKTYLCNILTLSKNLITTLSIQSITSFGHI